jgi:co-chaperonin GroES (HSP10)
MIMTETPRPFNYYIAVVDPPADETQKDSGLILPAHIAEGELSIGIIIDLGEAFVRDSETVHSSGWVVEKGWRIYYKKNCGYRIGDTHYIKPDCIIAYEEL